MNQYSALSGMAKVLRETPAVRDAAKAMAPAAVGAAVTLSTQSHIAGSVAKETAKLAITKSKPVEEAFVFVGTTLLTAAFALVSTPVGLIGLAGYGIYKGAKRVLNL